MSETFHLNFKVAVGGGIEPPQLLRRLGLANRPIAALATYRGGRDCRNRTAPHAPKAHVQTITPQSRWQAV